MTQQLTDSSVRVMERVFHDLAAQWHSETGHLSDMGKATAHPIYRALIALGPRVIPFMLRDLQSEKPDHWFAALEEITGENPIVEEDRGRVRKMADSWIKWGAQRGYCA